MEREEIRRDAGGILDLERLTSRMTLGVATPRDLLALRQSLEKIPALRGLLEPLAQSLLRSRAAPGAATGCAARAAGRDGGRARNDCARDCGRSAGGGERSGSDSAGISTRSWMSCTTLRKQGRQIIAAMEERERKRTGIGSLKIRYNQVFGFYIEISKPNLHLAPADYERKQTLVNAERFTSTELKEHERKVLSAEERVLEIERRLYIGDSRGDCAGGGAIAEVRLPAIAQLDVLVNFARIAASRNYTRPEFTETRCDEKGKARGADDRGRAASGDRETLGGARRAVCAE